MKYHLFCDAEWNEPISLNTESPLQIGHTVCLMDSDTEGRTYRITAIEHTALQSDEFIDTFETTSVLIATMVRISQAELDQGPQPGYATPTKES